MPENGFNELPDSVSLDSGDSQLSRQSLSIEAADTILPIGNTSQNNFDPSNDLSNILGNLEIEDNGLDITESPFSDYEPVKLGQEDYWQSGNSEPWSNYEPIDLGNGNNNEPWAEYEPVNLNDNNPPDSDESAGTNLREVRRRLRREGSEEFIDRFRDRHIKIEFPGIEREIPAHLPKSTTRPEPEPRPDWWRPWHIPEITDPHNIDRIMRDRLPRRGERSQKPSLE